MYPHASNMTQSLVPPVFAGRYATSDLDLDAQATTHTEDKTIDASKEATPQHGDTRNKNRNNHDKVKARDYATTSTFPHPKPPPSRLINLPSSATTHNHHMKDPPITIDLDFTRLLESYGILSASTSSHSTSTIFLDALLPGPRSGSEIGQRYSNTAKTTGKVDATGEENVLPLTPPSSDSDNGKCSGKEIRQIDVDLAGKGSEVAGLNKKAEDRVERELEEVEKSVEEDQAGPTTDTSILGDFTLLYAFLTDLVTKHTTLATQHDSLVQSFLPQPSSSHQTPLSNQANTTTALQSIPHSPSPVERKPEFRELGSTARRDYYDNSLFLAAARDGSIRKPRGRIPSATPGDTSDTPSAKKMELMLPLEAYYTPVKSRIITALENLSETLPLMFPNEAGYLAKYKTNPELALGDKDGKVIWNDGVGVVARDDSRPNSVGYTGGVGSDKKGGVHLFMDHSNIFLSFLATLSEQRSTLPSVLPYGKKTLSIPVLTLLLARGRPIKAGRMHLAGSSPLMQNLDPAVKLGWCCNILKRVPADQETELAKLEVNAKKYASKQLAAVGGTSESEVEPATTDTDNNDYNTRKFQTPPVLVRKNREQAVDEMLQLKLCQTIIRNTPSHPLANSHTNAPIPSTPGGTLTQSTLVLATGDGKGGQFNESGFAQCVQDALDRGWNVELWAWSQGLAKVWGKFEGRKGFVFYRLDRWLDELVEMA